jgi:hypothetical protein
VPEDSDNVAAIENVAKRIATMPVVHEKASKPGRKVTDALNTTAPLRTTTKKVGLLSKGRKEGCMVLTTRQVHAPMTSVGGVA